MSYILQALKKSQQDRELGQVPTLSTSADGVAPMPPRGINPWSFGALILALTAVLIALYGIFGNRPHPGGDQAATLPRSAPSLEADGSVRPTAAAQPGPEVAREPAAPNTRLTPPRKNDGPQMVELSLAEGSSGLRPKSSAPGPAQPKPALLPTEDTKATKIARAARAQAQSVGATAVAEPAAPSGAAASSTARATPSAGTKSPRRPAAARTGGENAIDYSRGSEAYSEFLRSEAKRLGERLAKLDAPPVLTPIKDSKQPTPTAKVRPPDLERPATARKLPQITPPASIEPLPPQDPAVTDTGDRPPLARQLPQEIHRALPDRQIIAHIYAKEPERRFISVNSTKLREGDQTADGLTLHEVRPDGIVFQFRNHQFFQPR